jgi:hypothetical protein
MTATARTNIAPRAHIDEAIEKHSKFRRARRLMLILAGTALLSGTIAPVTALADPAPKRPPATTSNIHFTKTVDATSPNLYP